MVLEGLLYFSLACTTAVVAAVPAAYILKWREHTPPANNVPSVSESLGMAQVKNTQ